VRPVLGRGALANGASPSQRRTEWSATVSTGRTVVAASAASASGGGQAQRDGQRENANGERVAWLEEMVMSQCGNLERLRFNPICHAERNEASIRALSVLRRADGSFTALLMNSPRCHPERSEESS